MCVSIVTFPTTSHYPPSHQCVPDGFEYFADGHLITVFSATNYCGRDKNHGALLEVAPVDNVLLVTPKMIEPLNDMPSNGWRRWV
jgi:hypothetical protein